MQTSDTRAASGQRAETLCRELPDAVEQISGRHVAYSVGGKKIAYLLEDHHGDGRLGLCFNAAGGTRLLTEEPTRFCSPAYIGARGWIGADLDVVAID